MGLLFLIEDYTKGNTTLYFMYYIVLHSIGIFYFLKIHRKIFKKHPSGGFAVFLSLVGMGYGQAYNRQYFKGLFFCISIGLSILGLRQEFMEINLAVCGYIFIGLLLVSVIDAGLGSKSAQKRIKQSMQKQHFQARIDTVLQHNRNNQEFGVDTNILMHEPDLLVYLLEKESIPLNISMSVFNELEGLKKNENQLTRKRSQLAFDIIEEYQRKGQLKIIKTPSTEYLREKGLSGSPDDKIIGTYLMQFLSENQNIIFLSNDKGARIIARNVGLPVADI